MARQQRLPGVDWHEGDIRREETLAAGAKEYARGQGLPYRPGNIAAVRADPNVYHVIGGIAQAQQGAPPHMSEQLAASYASFHEGVNRQYAHLTTPVEEGGLGITHEVSAEDPYKNIAETMEDVRTNRRLRTLATATTEAGQGREGSPGAQNPMMPADINDKFRAVHDAFGHLAVGRSFDRHGEAAAAQHHAAMFPPEAHPALFAESRIQNAALIRMGNFPENKPYDVPDWVNQVKPQLPKAQRRQMAPAPTLFDEGA
jgi:hypothetical protein